MRDWGTESLSNLPKVTKLKISRVKSQAQAGSLWVFADTGV